MFPEGKTPEELIVEYGKEAVLTYGLLGLATLDDSPESFGAAFELLAGFRLHSEGERWIENAYYAYQEGKGSLQECHREAGKTTVLSKFFVAYRIGKEPHKTWGIIRKTDQKAKETARGIAQIIEHSPMWKLLFPDVVPDPDMGWGENGYYVRDNSYSESEWRKISTSTPDDPSFVGYGWQSGSIIGSRYSGGAAIDDIVDEDLVASETLKAKVKIFVTDTLQYCIMEGAWEIWNFTPWTTTDIYAYVKSTGEYVHSLSPVIIPAEEGAEGAEYWDPMPLNPDYPEIGNIPLSGRWYYRYWSEAWSWERLAGKYRKSGALGFARQLLLDLDAAKGLNLKHEWIHRYPAEKIDPSWATFFGIDYASTMDKLKSKDRDYFALAVLKAIPGGGLVLVDGYRAKISKGEALSQTVAMYGVYPNVQLVGVETIGKGEEFYSDLVFVNDASGVPLPLFPIPSHKGGKGERFEKWLAPRFRMARIWVSNVSTPFIEAFIDEWLTYPQGANDDTLDAVYMGVLAGEGHLPVAEKRESALYKRDIGVKKSPLATICADRVSSLKGR